MCECVCENNVIHVSKCIYKIYSWLKQRDHACERAAYNYCIHPRKMASLLGVLLLFLSTWSNVGGRDVNANFQSSKPNIVILFADDVSFNE